MSAQTWMCQPAFGSVGIRLRLCQPQLKCVFSQLGDVGLSLDMSALVQECTCRPQFVCIVIIYDLSVSILDVDLSLYLSASF